MEQFARVIVTIVTKKGFVYSFYFGGYFYLEYGGFWKNVQKGFTSSNIFFLMGVLFYSAVFPKIINPQEK